LHEEEYPAFAEPVSGGGCRLFIWAAPGAKNDALAGVIEGRLKVRIKARAVENKANEALCVYLAGLLGVPRGALTIVSGLSGRKKTICVRGDVQPGWRALEKVLSDG